MVFGAYNWLGLIFWIIVSITAIMGSWLIVKNDHRWKKNMELVSGIMSARFYFIAWAIIWIFNIPAIFLFWNFPIHHVEVNGVTLTQDNAPGINYGIYNSALIFYVVTYIIYLLWVLVYWTETFTESDSRYQYGLIWSIFLWLTSAVTLALFFSICSCTGVSKNVCWVPGLLNVPHILLATYTLFSTAAICYHS